MGGCGDAGREQEERGQGCGHPEPEGQGGQPCIAPKEKGPYLMQGCGRREQCVGGISCPDVACGRVVGVSAPALGLEQPGPRSCGIPWGKLSCSGCPGRALRTFEAWRCLWAAEGEADQQLCGGAGAKLYRMHPCPAPCRPCKAFSPVPKLQELGCAHRGTPTEVTPGSVRGGWMVSLP